VLLIECLRTAPGILIPAHEISQCGSRRSLPKLEQITRLALRVCAVDYCGLILEVQDEPQFYARVGNRNADPRCGGKFQRSVNVGMLIDVEYTPIIAVCVTASSTGCTKIDSTPSSGRFDKLQRSAVKFIDGDDNALTENTTPVRQVDRLCLQTFSEDQDGPALSGARRPPLWLTAALLVHSRSPTALSATSANSSRARIGVAPYLPARYLRPIASSLRGLRSASGYSLVAPSWLFSVNHT